MRISIIIINYKTALLLKDCLESIKQFYDKDNIEIIIVDNSPPELLRQFSETTFSEVRLVENYDNPGFGRANNQAAKMATGEILFFLNPDTLIKENIFQKIINIFEKDPRVGIVAPQLILPDLQLQPWAYGHEEGFWKLIKNKFEKNQLNRGQDDLPFEVDWVSGAALAIRRDVFNKIDGFDKNFFMYFEDRDLCYRVKKMGYKIIVLPEIKVIHFGGKSLTKNRERKKIYYQAQNYYWKKHCGYLKSIFLRFIRWPYKIYRLIREDN